MSDSGNSTPPGWYPDGQGGQRWWDGSQWGPVGQPPAQAAPPTAPMPTSPPPSGPPSGAPQYGGYAAPAAGFGQQPGQAQYNQGQPSSSGPRTKLLLAIIGGLVGVVVLIVVLVLVLGGGSGASSDDPAETVSSFFDAAKDGDCDAAVALLSDNGRDALQADDCEGSDPAEGFGDASYDLGEAQIDGDAATVPVSVTDESGTLGVGEVSVDFELVKQDGAWLIDGISFESLLDGLPDDLTSDLPSDFDPDEFLSDLPTDLPTDFLSDLPTDLPSDFPSDFDPEDFLSDLPSDFLSDFPSDFLSDLPTG